MTDQEKLTKAFEDTIWMAIRYAHGRSTYAPSMVRDAVKLMQDVYPDWEPRPDPTIEPLIRDQSYQLASDCLFDILPTKLH